MTPSSAPTGPRAANLWVCDTCHVFAEDEPGTGGESCEGTVEAVRYVALADLLEALRGPTSRLGSGLTTKQAEGVANWIASLYGKEPDRE